MHLAAREALSLFAASSATRATSTAGQSSVTERPPTGPLSRSAARPRSPAPPRSAIGGTSPRIRSARIASPEHGGIDWLLLTLLFAAGATAVWLIYSQQRPHPATGAADIPARLRHGAGALAGAVGLVALRAAVAERRSHAQIPKRGRAPAIGPAIPPAETTSLPAPDLEARPTEKAAPSTEDSGDRIADAIAAFELGSELADKNDLTGAEAALRHADEHGHPSGATNLGVLLEQRGDLAGAEAAYRRADERGDATGAFNLGGLLAERHDLASAEAAFRRADERGDAAGAANLGMLLEQRGDLAGAEAAYRRADRTRRRERRIQPGGPPRGAE